MAVATRTRDLVYTRLFEAPVERVWKAWTEAEQVMKWWGPTGFTCPVCRMDFREGGVTLVCMRAPAEHGGMNMYNTWTYKRIVPLQRIEYVLHFTDKDGKRVAPGELMLPPGIPLEVPHVLTLKSVDGGTELTLKEEGYTTDEIVEISRMGLGQCMDKMESILTGKRP